MRAPDHNRRREMDDNAICAAWNTSRPSRIHAVESIPWHILNKWVESDTWPKDQKGLVSKAISRPGKPAPGTRLFSRATRRGDAADDCGHSSRGSLRAYQGPARLQEIFLYLLKSVSVKTWPY